MIRYDGTVPGSGSRIGPDTPASVEQCASAQTSLSYTGRRRPVGTALGIIVLAAGILSLTYAYVSSENTFYTSDYGGYQRITEGLLNSYLESFRSAVRVVVSSIDAEYNAFFAIPLVPFLLAFGDSRLSYELALAATYLLPFTIVIGAIAVQLIPNRPQFAFWLSAALLLLTPMAWCPRYEAIPIQVLRLRSAWRYGFICTTPRCGSVGSPW